MTAEDYCKQLSAANPGVRFATSKDGTAVGAWIENEQRFAMVLSRTVDEKWVWHCNPDGSIQESWINGQPPYGYGTDQWDVAAES